MGFTSLNTRCRRFSRWVCIQRPDFKKPLNEEQMRVRMENLFGVADFYSSNLRKLGHEAYNIHVNTNFVQRA